MKVSRAVSCISALPNLTDITEDEVHELWNFLNRPVRCPLTRQMARIRLAAECEVFPDVFNASIGSNSIVTALIWESSDSKSTGMTLEQVIAFFSSDDFKLLPLCHTLNSDEAEFVWRWAFNERWRSVVNRMKKWMGDDVQEDLGEHRLKPWKEATTKIPKEWWLVEDVSTLRLAIPRNQWIIRDRNGRFDVELTEKYEHTDVMHDEPQWIWKDRNLGYHNLIHEVPSSDISWAESVQLMQLQPRGALLIHDDGYYLLTSGTTSLYGQILRVRRLNDTYYELEIGFLDGDTTVEVCTIRLPTLPFELEQVFGRMGIRYNYGRSWHDIEQSLVARVALIWNPDDDWHFRYDGLETDMGASDVSQLVDYQMLMGGLDE
tara:strand:+ start:151 stop:1278 length:1128 start_codon:yes stop_codon:yes gene_type:complete